MSEKRVGIKRYNVAKNASEDNPSYEFILHIVISEGEKSSLTDPEGESHDTEFSYGINLSHSSPRVSLAVP